MSVSQERTGVNMDIVHALEKYGKVEEGILARLVGRTAAEVKEPLVRLREKGVIREADGQVALAQ